ncbi:MAG: HpcH/HpaI aldolase/citrate lyase family protein [Acidimicrobiia bacterium]
MLPDAGGQRKVVDSSGELVYVSGGGRRSLSSTVRAMSADGLATAARSYLYVPGDRPERFEKAGRSGADAVILDLEDAVAPAAKDEARAAVVAWLRAAPPPPQQWWVRINAGERGDDDVAALEGCRVQGVFVPKATPERLAALASSGLALCALVETAEAVVRAVELARSEAVVALAMGEVDLVAELGIEQRGTDDPLWPIRSQVVVACAAVGLQPPIGPVSVDFSDMEALRRSTQALRGAGFFSRQAIHPAQVPVINEVMTPSEDDMARAARVLELFERAAGGVCVDDDGRMVDEAVIRSARRTVARGRLRQSPLGPATTPAS